MDIHFAVEIEVIHGASAAAAQHAAGVGIVHHEDCPIFFASLTISGSLAISPSMENTPSVTTRCAAAFRCFQCFSQGIHVSMGEDLDLRPAEARTVDDAGMVELITDNHIFPAQNAAYCACIGLKSRLKTRHASTFLNSASFTSSSR